MRCLHIYLLLLLLSTVTFTQVKSSGKDILAEGKFGKIYKQDFENRINLIPNSIRNLNTDSTKLYFLYSLIAEKLLAQDVIDRKFDTNEIIYRTELEQQQIFINDAVYRNMVESKVNFTNKDIDDGLEKSRYILMVNAVANKDSLQLLKDLEEIDKIGLESFFANKYGDAQKPYQINFGSLENEEFETEIFSLQPNQHTKPYHAKKGWLVIFLKEKTANPNFSIELKNNVINIVKLRRANKISEEFLENNISNAKISSIDSSLKILYGMVKNDFNEKNNKYLLDINKIWLNINSKQKELYYNVVKIIDKEYSIKDILYYLLNHPFYLSSLKEDIIVSGLYKAVYDMAGQNLITFYGLNKGFNTLPEVKSDISERVANISAEVFRDFLLDSLRQTTNKGKSDQNQEVKEYKVQEILLSSINKAEDVLKILNNGNFVQLAKEVTIRTAPFQNGELGFITESDFGKIGRTLPSLKLNQIYGPIKTPDGYSIFRIVEIRDRKLLDTELDKKAKLDADNNASKILDKYVASLAEKNGVKVYKKNLSEVDLNEVETLTYRIMGYGDKILAKPITYPNYKWMNYFKPKEL